MKTVLVVENNPDLLALFNHILKADQINVTGCKSALDMFSALQKAIPDLIIIDIVRTGVDANMIRENLRSRNALKTIPIIITSTKTNEVSDYASFGADEGIEKPFDAMVVKEKVRSLLGC